ncbi:MAG: signal peptidase I [Actinomycetales bacterium]
MTLARTAPEGGAPVPPGSASDDADDADRTPTRRTTRDLLVLVGIALVLTLVVRAFVVQAFYIPSGSMEQTLHVGDRVLVSKLSYRFADIHRGDVVVFDGTGTFAPEVTPATGTFARVARSVGAFFGMAPSEHDFVKRVVGLPGDSVRCCTSQGLLSVNGVPVQEPYLYPGDTPSAEAFNIVVPGGRLWVMGDHRSDSADSRAHLGEPGGGTVPESRVIGKVVAIYWPLGRVGTPAEAPQLAKVHEGTGVAGAR